MTKIEDIGNYVIFSESIYDKKCPTLYSLCKVINTAISFYTGRSRIRTKWKKYSCAYVFNKTNSTIDAMCNIYVKNGFIGLCIGRAEALKILIDKYSMRSVIVLNDVELEAKEKRVLNTIYGRLTQYILI